MSPSAHSSNNIAFDRMISKQQKSKITQKGIYFHDCAIKIQRSYHSQNVIY